MSEFGGSREIQYERDSALNEATNHLENSKKPLLAEKGEQEQLRPGG